ncbi:hypothetical protein [Streptomyces sp. NPDC018693]|uniref:hypothetical protein n=1 Tax=unclassified Streptomyces TaxID=2593676 RepID=UPI0037A7810E
MLPAHQQQEAPWRCRSVNCSNLIAGASTRPPVEGCYGAQGMYGNGFRGEVNPVRRWAYTPEMWEGVLRTYGFLEVYAKVFEAPDPKNLGTLIVQAHVV